ncbi:MAG: CDGSH iron-sulfur domain-containing protein [Polyangiaceae bacterium]
MSTQIKCAPNGPLLTEGPLTLTDPTGKNLEIPAGKKIALCRCGFSQNKPFCDGQHSKQGFKADEEAKAP